MDTTPPTSEAAPTPPPGQVTGSPGVVSAPTQDAPRKLGRKPLDPVARAENAKRSILKKQIARLAKSAELQDLEQQVSELRAKKTAAKKAAPTQAAPPRLELVHSAPSAPTQPAVRPGWPTDEQIAEATPLVAMLWNTLATISAGTKFERCFSGDTIQGVVVNGKVETKVVPKLDALISGTAPVVAKYGAGMKESPELLALTTCVSVLGAPFLMDLYEKRAKQAGAPSAVERAA